MATVTAIPLLGFVGSYGKNKCLIEYAKCCGGEAERVNLHTGITRVSTVALQYSGSDFVAKLMLGGSQQHLCRKCISEQCLGSVCHIKPQPGLHGRSEGGFVCWLRSPERARKDQK